jgi:hypothetical protein
VNIYNNFYIIIDDYNQNHINDNVVTIADPDQQMVLSYMNRKSICDPETKQRIMTGMSTEKQIGTLTKKFIYASNQIIEDQNKRIGERAIRTKGEGVYLSNVFATIPLKLSSFGQIYTGDSGSLANQNRTYFGPVNISRMNVKLVNHLGDTVDLNGQNWSMSLICDSLYQRQTMKK